MDINLKMETYTVKIDARTVMYVHLENTKLIRIFHTCSHFLESIEPCSKIKIKPWWARTVCMPLS